MPYALPAGATLADIAARARAWRKYRAVGVMMQWPTYSGSTMTTEQVALDWIMQADEAGYDTGRPREPETGR